MDVLLFDTNPIRRKDWSKICSANSAHLFCLQEFDEKHFASVDASRIVVFDKSVIDDPVAFARQTIRRIPYDIVSFSIPQCSVGVATRLMKLGVRWVFDNSLERSDLAEGFCELLRDAGELDFRVKQFHRVQALRAAITPGEQAVLNLVIDGVPNKLIATKLDISTRTVESRRSRVYRKCGVHSVTELVRFFTLAEALQKEFAIEELKSSS